MGHEWSRAGHEPEILAVLAILAITTAGRQATPDDTSSNSLSRPTDVRRRRGQCYVGICSLDQRNDAVVLPVSTPSRPTEFRLKCIGLPSLLARDEVVIDSFGADGISLQRLCDIAELHCRRAHALGEDACHPSPWLLL